MKRTKKNIRCIAVSLMVILALSLTYFITHVSRRIEVSSYIIEADVKGAFRIIQLTDLHNEVFGTDNRNLTELVKAQQPDIIVMTGDMLNKDDTNQEIICSLVRELKKTADVYYCMGNHEKSWIKRYGTSLSANLMKAGAEILDTDYKDITVNGTDVRIGGYMGYYGTPHLTSSDKAVQEEDLQFMRSFEDTDRYKILLDHIPTSWVDWNYMDQYPVDLILCGHYHGGQMRLPFLGPVYAPYVGWWPENVQGLFRGEKGTCILSTGLGSEYGIPRLNNPPEIVIIDIF